MHGYRARLFVAWRKKGVLGKGGVHWMYAIVGMELHVNAAYFSCSCLIFCTNVVIRVVCDCNNWHQNCTDCRDRSVFAAWIGDSWG